MGSIVAAGSVGFTGVSVGAIRVGVGVGVVAGSGIVDGTVAVGVRTEIADGAAAVGVGMEATVGVTDGIAQALSIARASNATRLVPDTVDTFK